MSTEIATLLVRSPDVCGGRLRIDGTRITVNQIALLNKQGYDAEEIADQYPHLTLAQVYAALSHYHANQEEVEADLTAEEQEALRAEEEQISDLTGHGEVTRAEPLGRLEAFKELQRRLNLTPAKAAEWQEAVHEARR
jgi:uncharacterized protein (DUF433 family)